MFKQLTYFQYLEDDLRTVQERARELNGLLTDAYSPPEKVYCSLKEQIDNILNEQEQLQEVVSVILQQITTGTFIPLQIQSHQMSQMFLNSLVLPDWFPHVLEKEYTKFKQELDNYTRSLATMHGLQQKRKLMREQRQNLETLYRRTLAISALQKKETFSDIDIMQDVNHLRNRVKHVRKAFQYFCTQVASKMRDFVEELVDKTTSFSKLQSPTSSNIRNSGRQVSDVFKSTDQFHKARSYYNAVQLPEESFKHYDRFTNLSPRSNLNSPNNKIPLRQESTRENYDNYYSRAENLNPKEKGFASPRNHEHFNYGFKSTCINHEDLTSTHRHTCEKGRDWLRSAKSQQRLHLHSSPLQKETSKYNYRRFIPSRGNQYF